MNYGAIRIGAHDDVAKLFCRNEASLSANGIGHCRSGRCGISGHLTGWVHSILLIEGADEIADGQPEFREDLRLNPNAHGTVGGAKQYGLAGARYAQELIDDIDVRVVREKRESCV